MARKNNLGDKKHKLTVLDNSKGGQSKSPAKVLSSRINGLMNRKDLSDEKRYLLALLKDKKISDLIMELISMNLEDVDDVERRDKTLEQLQRLLPTRNINLDVSAGVDNNFSVSAYQRFRDAVFATVSTEQRVLILERSRASQVVDVEKEVVSFEDKDGGLE